MGQSPWPIGDREPYWLIGLAPDSGFLDISGLTESDFKMTFTDVASNAERDGTGTFVGLTGASGGTPATITYQPGATDVATAGVFSRRVVIKAGTVHQRSFDLGYWICEQ